MFNLTSKMILIIYIGVALQHYVVSNSICLIGVQLLKLFDLFS